jgi:hypothetical protein
MLQQTAVRQHAAQPRQLELAETLLAVREPLFVAELADITVKQTEHAIAAALRKLLLIRTHLPVAQYATQ